MGSGAEQSGMGFAIIGTGLIADFHARAIKAMQGGYLQAVCSRTKERAAEFATKYECTPYNSISKVLADPKVDIVVLATPSGLHLDDAVAAAAAGKHVICEKPLEINLERVDAMIAAHELAGTKLGCIFQLRYMPVIAAIRQLLSDNRLGTLTYGGVHVPWWRADEYYKDSSWHGSLELDGGGALINQSIHMIDLLCDLMPEVEQVAGFTSSAGHPYMEGEDAGVAALRFKGGALGVIYGTTSAWPGQKRRLEINGTKGSLVMEDNFISFLKLADDPDGSAEKLLAEFGVQDTQRATSASNPAAMDFYLHQQCFEDFANALQGKTEYGIDGCSGRRSVAVIEAIYSSNKEGKVISFV